MSLETLIKHVMIRLLLPKNQKYRNEIARLCGQIFELIHGNQIVTAWYAKKKREKVSVSPALDSLLFPNNENVYCCPNAVDKQQLLTFLTKEHTVNE
eukprot:515922_1